MVLKANANKLEDDPMGVDALSRKWVKGKGKFDKGQKGCKKGKDSHTGKGHGEPAPEKRTNVEGECRHCGQYGHKAADCWHKHPKSQGKGEGKAKSKVSEGERE